MEMLEQGLGKCEDGDLAWKDFVTLEKPPDASSLQRLLDAQRQIIHRQIEDLQRLVVMQCRITGANPLSEEMAAAVMGTKAGKRPGDSLTPKALNCLYNVFSIKDTITKKEACEISALCGATVMQVRDFFSGQRSRVRRLMQQTHGPTGNFQNAIVAHHLKHAFDDASHDKMEQSGLANVVEKLYTEVNSMTDQLQQGLEVNVKDKMTSDINSSNIVEITECLINLMHKENTFAGQIKLAQLILQARQGPVLRWFISKGGLQLLCKWLVQAASEEQTSLLRILLKALVHLPLGSALPRQMSSLLQTVNKLRFYRAQDVASRARLLLSRWSRFLRSTASGRFFGSTGSLGAPQGLYKRSRDATVLQVESDIMRKKAKIETAVHHSGPSELSVESLPPETGDSQRPFVETLASQGTSKKSSSLLLADCRKVHRKVRLFEEAGLAVRRSKKVAIPRSMVSRPLSADDIKKAKRRACLLQSLSSPKIRKSVNNHELMPSCSTGMSIVSCPESDVATSTDDQESSRKRKDDLQQARPKETEKLSGVDNAIEVPMHEALLSGDSGTLSIESQDEKGMGTEILQENKSWGSVHSRKGSVFDAVSLKMIDENGGSVGIMACDAEGINTSNDLTASSSQQLERSDAIPQAEDNIIRWQRPSRLVLDPRWRVACGEESTERIVQSIRLNNEQEALYPSLDCIPSNPGEPLERVSLFDDDTNVPELLLEALGEDSQNSDSPRVSHHSEQDHTKITGQEAESKLVVSSEEIQSIGDEADSKLLLSSIVVEGSRDETEIQLGVSPKVVKENGEEDKFQMTEESGEEAENKLAVSSKLVNGNDEEADTKMAALAKVDEGSVEEEESKQIVSLKLAKGIDEGAEIKSVELSKVVQGNGDDADGKLVVSSNLVQENGISDVWMGSRQQGSASIISLLETELAKAGTSLREKDGRPLPDLGSTVHNQSAGFDLDISSKALPFAVNKVKPSHGILERSQKKSTAEQARDTSKDHQSRPTAIRDPIRPSHVRGSGDGKQTGKHSEETRDSIQNRQSRPAAITDQVRPSYVQGTGDGKHSGKSSEQARDTTLKDHHSRPTAITDQIRSSYVQGSGDGKHSGKSLPSIPKDARQSQVVGSKSVCKDQLRMSSGSLNTAYSQRIQHKHDHFTASAGTETKFDRISTSTDKAKTAMNRQEGKHNRQAIQDNIRAATQSNKISVPPDKAKVMVTNQQESKNNRHAIRESERSMTKVRPSMEADLARHGPSDQKTCSGLQTLQAVGNSKQFTLVERLANVSDQPRLLANLPFHSEKSSTQDKGSGIPDQPSGSSDQMGTSTLSENVKTTLSQVTAYGSQDSLGINIADLSKEACIEMLRVVLQQLASSSGGSGADLELLAVFLKNPDLVYALTSAQAALSGKGLSAITEVLKGKSPNVTPTNISSIQAGQQRASVELNSAEASQKACRDKDDIVPAVASVPLVPMVTPASGGTHFRPQLLQGIRPASPLQSRPPVLPIDQPSQSQQIQLVKSDLVSAKPQFSQQSSFYTADRGFSQVVEDPAKVDKGSGWVQRPPGPLPQTSSNQNVGFQPNLARRPQVNNQSISNPGFDQHSTVLLEHLQTSVATVPPSFVRPPSPASFSVLCSSIQETVALQPSLPLQVEATGQSSAARQGCVGGMYSPFQPQPRQDNALGRNGFSFITVPNTSIGGNLKNLDQGRAVGTSRGPDLAIFRENLQQTGAPKETHSRNETVWLPGSASVPAPITFTGTAPPQSKFPHQGFDHTLRPLLSMRPPLPPGMPPVARPVTPSTRPIPPVPAPPRGVLPTAQGGTRQHPVIQPDATNHPRPSWRG